MVIAIFRLGHIAILSLLYMNMILGLYSLRPYLACGKSLATSTLQNSSKRAPYSHLQGAMTLASSYTSNMDYISSVEQKINAIINLAAKKASSGGSKSTVVNIPAALRHQSRPLERRKRSPNQVIISLKNMWRIGYAKIINARSSFTFALGAWPNYQKNVIYTTSIWDRKLYTDITLINEHLLFYMFWP